MSKKRSKTGRNDPCPCGSGKKFKKCHGAMSMTAVPSSKMPAPDADRVPTPEHRIKTDYKVSGESEYSRLSLYEQTRFRELTGIYSDELKLIEEYERLVCRIIMMLGETQPKDNLDECMRDLACDAFDTLYVAKNTVLRDYLPLGFPLLRRAYETICLLSYFHLVPSKADKWQKGHQFDNAEIRKFLDSHPMGDKEEQLRELYRLYTKGTHVNRDFIPHRYLGDGNQFTLGSISRPDLFVSTDYMEQLVRLWFWFVAVIIYHYRELFTSLDAGFFQDYFGVANRAQPTIQSLFEAKHKISRTDMESEGHE